MIRFTRKPGKAKAALEPFVGIVSWSRNPAAAGAVSLVRAPAPVHNIGGSKPLSAAAPNSMRKKVNDYNHLTPRQRREFFEKNHYGTHLLDELPICGWLHFLEAMPMGIDPQQHHGNYEFHVVVRGVLRQWIGEPSNAFEIGAGQVFMTRPGELHGGVDLTLHPCELYWFQVHFPEKGALPGLASEHDTQLREAFTQMRQPVFSGSEALLDACARLMSEHRIRGPYSLLRARSAYHDLLTCVAECQHAAQKSPQRQMSEPIMRAVERIRTNLGEPIRVEELAEWAGLGCTRFRERFVSEVGMGPHEFLVVQRIEAAKRLLADPKLSVTDISYRLGFSASSHLASAFYKVCGMTPRQFRVRILNQSDTPSPS